MIDKTLIMQTDYAPGEDMDFKYVLQDAGHYFLGAKYTYRELLGHDMVPFKFKAIAEHYIFKDTEPETTLESQLYYLTKEDFSYKTFEQLKVSVKVSQLTEKKKLFGKKRLVYEEKIYPLKEFCDINLAKKKSTGVIVRELVLSKIALMGFSV